MSECPGTIVQLKRPGDSKRSTKPRTATLQTLWEQCPASGSNYQEEEKSGGLSQLHAQRSKVAATADLFGDDAAEPSVDAQQDADTNALIDALFAARAALESADDAIANALAQLGVEEASDEDDDEPTDEPAAKASRPA